MNHDEIHFLGERGYQYTSVISSSNNYKVFKMYSTNYQRFFAVKKIDSDKFNSNELEIMKSLHHGNIIYLYDYVDYNGFTYLIFEYCQTDLYHLVETTQLSKAQITQFMYQILSAVQFIHSLNISHGDIKPSNILIDENGRIKLCDFGLAIAHARHKPVSNCYRGTLLFMAPEIFAKSGFDPIKADMWAVGVTFFYMITKTFPFYAEDQLALMQLISKGVFPQYKILDDGLRKVICRCLDFNPATRAGVEEVINMELYDVYAPTNLQARPRKRFRGSSTHNSVILRPNFIKASPSTSNLCPSPIRRRMTK